MRRARPLLGTVVEITAEGDAGVLPGAIEAAFASVDLVQRLMSFHDPLSDVSRINDAAAGRKIAVDPHTFGVLDFAQRLSGFSDGVFDVTIAPVLVANAFLPARPRETRPDSATYRDLDLLPDNGVRWRRKGWIDLGGIAKGYAVDCAVAVLRTSGVTSGVVNAGGDMRCFGEAQPVHVRHPDSPGSLLMVGWLTDAALASSAGYFSPVGAGDRRIDPLVDPRRHCCTNWDASVSVAAADAMTADALTKVVRLVPGTAPDILDRFEAEAVVIDSEGARRCGRVRLRETAGA